MPDLVTGGPDPSIRLTGLEIRIGELEKKLGRVEDRAEAKGDKMADRLEEINIRLTKLEGTVEHLPRKGHVIEGIKTAVAIGSSLAAIISVIYVISTRSATSPPSNPQAQPPSASSPTAPR